MTRPLNVACLQTRPRPDFSSALEEALSLAEIAAGAGAEFLALPEYCGGLKTDGAALVPPAAKEEDHPVLLGLREFAAKSGVWMAIGSVAVPGPGGKIRNRGFIIDDGGHVSDPLNANGVGNDVSIGSTTHIHRKSPAHNGNLSKNLPISA